MILGSWRELEVGRSYGPRWMTDYQQEYHEIPFQVLRVATEAEWRASQAEQGGQPDYPFDRPNQQGRARFFYEVSVD